MTEEKADEAVKEEEDSEMKEEVPEP